MPVGNIKSAIKAVAAAATPEALVAAATYVVSVTIKANDTNTNDVFVGDSTVDNAGTFPPLSPGTVITIGHSYDFNLADIFVAVAVNGEGVGIWYILP